MLKAIIVDDEPKAIRLLEDYLAHFAQIELVGTFRNGLKALDFVHQHTVDLILLDINMPHLSGMDLSKLLDHKKTKIIFTTAYSEYAVQSYEVQALDYLLKPISLERFTQAIQKILSTPKTDITVPQPASLIKVKCGSNIHQVKPDDIFYLQKDGNYMFYHLPDKKLMSRQSIAEALEILPNNFIQIHKSLIINLEKVDFYNRHEVSIQNTLLGIGSSFGEAVRQRFEQL